MTTDSPSIPTQYATGSTRESIEKALVSQGIDLDALTADQLGPLEHFHVSGPLATISLIDLLNVKAEDRVLDAGTGVGGTARYMAHKYGCKVSAVDLTAEYVATAQWLNGLVGLDELIDVREASVTDLPFADESFDIVVSQHVQMNVAGQGAALRRGVPGPGPGRPAGHLGRDGRAGRADDLPGAVADGPESSFLVTADALREYIVGAGFEVEAWNDLTESNTEFMNAVLAAPPSPLGLHVFVPDMGLKVQTLVRSFQENRSRLIQAVLVKRG